MEKIKAIIQEIKSSATIDDKIKLLPLILREINNLLFKIKKCKNFNEAEIFFDLLDEAQFWVASLIFNDQIEVSDELWKFFKDFDRMEDPGEREYLFNLIRNGNYSLLSNDNY